MKRYKIRVVILFFMFVVGCSSTNYVDISNYSDDDQIKLLIFTDIMIFHSNLNNSTVPLFLAISNNNENTNPPSFYFDYLRQKYTYVYPRSEMTIVKYESKTEKFNPNLKMFIHKKSKKQGTLISVHKPIFSNKTEVTVGVSTTSPPSIFGGEIYYLKKIAEDGKLLKKKQNGLVQIRAKQTLSLGNSLGCSLCKIALESEAFSIFDIQKK